MVFFTSNSPLYIFIYYQNLVGRRCIVKDCVVVDEGAIVKDDTVMPPFTRWAGAPAKIIEELPESMAYVSLELSVTYKLLWCLYQNKI